MMNNILKAYDEDLAKGALNAASIGSDKAIAAGDTQGALCVNAFAVGAVSVASDITITVKHGDTKEGAFAELFTIPVAATASFADGELMATATLPSGVKNYVTATVASATANSGNIRVTLGYLAR